MATAEFGFDLREVDGLSQQLKKAQLSPQDRTQLLKNIGAEVEAQTQERFDTQEDPEGKHWQDLSEKTKRYYAKHFPGRRNILVGEGGLRDSIESQVSDSWSVLIGATKVYAATHQIGRGGIPARPYLGISSDNAADIALLTRQFLAGRLK
jgi:phage virion morphogenesis protein